MSNYDDRRRDSSRDDRMGDREAADMRDRRHDQVRNADMGQTPRNIQEYEDRVRAGYPRVSGDEHGHTDRGSTERGSSERAYGGGYTATGGTGGSSYGERDDRGGRSETGGRGYSGSYAATGGNRGDRDSEYSEHPRGPSAYQADRFSDRGLGYRSFSGSLGGGMGQQYGYGQGGRGLEDNNNPRSYRSGRPAQHDEDRGFFNRAGDEIASWFGSDEAEHRRERDARQGDEGARHHVGRGPRNYKRSDSRIEEDINDRLTRDPYVDASDIDVSVKDGEVTLSGQVESRSDKRRAEDLADDVSGVKHVQNNLRIRGREGTGSGSQATGQSASGLTGGTTTTGTTTAGIGGTGTATGAGSSSIGTTGASSATGATIGGSFGNSRNE